MVVLGGLLCHAFPFPLPVGHHSLPPVQSSTSQEIRDWQAAIQRGCDADVNLIISPDASGPMISRFRLGHPLNSVLFMELLLQAGSRLRVNLRGAVCY